MSCYLIAHIRIRDPKGYQRYLDGFDKIFAEYSGHVVAVDDSPIILEGTWSYTRAVVIRFPNEEEAKLWYESPEYQTLAEYRRRASEADIILVRGRDRFPSPSAEESQDACPERSRREGDTTGARRTSTFRGG